MKKVFAIIIALLIGLTALPVYAGRRPWKP